MRVYGRSEHTPCRRQGGRRPRARLQVWYDFSYDNSCLVCGADGSDYWKAARWTLSAVAQAEATRLSRKSHNSSGIGHVVALGRLATAPSLRGKMPHCGVWA